MSSFERLQEEGDHNGLHERKGRGSTKSTNLPEMHAHNILTAEQQKRMNAYESLDYDVVHGRTFEQALAKKSPEVRQHEELMKWILCVGIALVTALIGLVVDVVVKNIIRLKLLGVHALVDQNKWWPAFLFYCFYNCCCVGIATVLVVKGEPVAGGSGIPEVKSYLNGIKIPRLLRLRTLFCKAVGVVFSVCGGLAVGKEGPMIHVGSVVAAGFSQMGSKSLDMQFAKNFRPFRNDHDKRDFVSVGAGTGVAAAFGSPTGGTLFVIEEGASFWNQPLTWKTYFSCVLCTFVLNFFLSGMNGTSWGKFSQAGLIAFGAFDAGEESYNIWEIPFFIFLGVVGGLAGALFISVNKKMTIWRMKNIVPYPKKRMAEAVLVALITAMVSFIIPTIFMNCRTVPDASVDPEYSQRFFCPKGQLSGTATLFFTTMEVGIKELFHREASFSVPALLLFVPIYFALALLTYGIAVPSGLFVPSLLSGASVGRLFGHFLRDAIGLPVNPGHYALIGASAMLGGMARMTLSLTVIIIETTNNIQFGLPIMIAIYTAKLLGDHFTPGIYDLHIGLKNAPLIEWLPPRQLEHMKACDIMADKPVTIHEVERVRSVVETLKSCKHSGFPVTAGKENHFTGIILRSQIGLIVAKKAFQSTPHPYVDQNLVDEMGEEAVGQAPNIVREEEFLDAYPNFPDATKIDLTEEELDMWIDLSPYINANPTTVHFDAPATRVFRLFRATGLRHLVVLNSSTRVVGVVTRKDLVEGSIESAYEKKRELMASSA